MSQRKIWKKTYQWVHDNLETINGAPIGDRYETLEYVACHIDGSLYVPADQREMIKGKVGCMRYGMYFTLKITCSKNTVSLDFYSELHQGTQQFARELSVRKVIGQRPDCPFFSAPHHRYLCITMVNYGKNQIRRP